MRELRWERRWTQRELAHRLGVSQPHLSQVENGVASMRAETLLRALHAFGVGIDSFDAAPAETDVVQNALARLGAHHLVDDGAPVPPELGRPVAILVDVLTSPRSPRHVAALAPVVVAHIDRVSLDQAAVELSRLGRARRIGWFAESLVEALGRCSPSPRQADERASRRTRLAAELLLDSRLVIPPPAEHPIDAFDGDLRSTKSVERVFSTASVIAKRWRLATALDTSDFTEALEAARASRR
ncbi:MAG: helix-turn-helix domain-containing protein [Sandaracinaceae bacterium]|nr:helix-turn-helix domain-containing protein [Sandaracinaceae bacterium]